MSPTVALHDTPAPTGGLSPPTLVPAALTPGSADGLRVSEETYWQDYYLEADIHYEWNNGRLEEKPVSDYETYLVYAWFVELLRHFLRARPIRCRPWRAKRGPVVPGRRRRERIAVVA